MTDSPIPEGWTAHDGGPMPVERETRPGFMFRSGKIVLPGVHTAQYYDWWWSDPHHPADIIAYQEVT